MIWLQLVVICILLATLAYAPNAPLTYDIGASVLTLGITCLFLIGLKQERIWVAALFAALCLFDFLSAIGGGFSFENSLNLVDAVLSFVAICGLIIWFRERKRAPA
ncbi:hypothetical protein AKJ29_17020 [Aliiroseovarius crassostreae]|uniref:Uncharacterized protein n=1 Tax=Aliiroseovarius crassostreae TaxID=154981 RepID=A0A0P7IXB7_9RHOB|nr:hypothetical protein [Aliiroseovarius crassostreae]KPN64330.1 hypothetical protein AKJ29_17020 [Aliiroseovarius crassostreae]